MFCKIVQNIALFIFWRCIDEKTRNESIRKHTLSKLKAENVETIVEKVDIYKNKYEQLKNMLINLNNEISEFRYEKKRIVDEISKIVYITEEGKKND